MTRWLVAMMFVLLGANVYAWNDFGHMTVAAIAYQHLTPAARSKVGALLKLNPNYRQWIAGVPTADQTRVAFIEAATWPDLIKRAPGYIRDGEDNGNRPSGPDADRNIGYSDKLQHRYWHFIDRPFSPDGTTLIDPIAPNAKTEIALLRDALRSPTTSDDVKSYDLVWLLHLVGDVHQPLHATSRFDKDQPDGDRGGNLVSLCAKPCKDELHAFWDSALGNSTKLGDAVRKARRLPPADTTLAAVSDESIWIEESFQAAHATVYAAPVGVGPGPFSLDEAYKTKARAVAAERVALAGMRLASLLNEALQ